MSYRYEDYKDFTFTDEGQRELIKTRDYAFRMCKEAGCVRALEMINQMGSVSSWNRMAVIDRLVELGDLKEVLQSVQHAWQYKIFVKARN